MEARRSMCATFLISQTSLLGEMKWACVQLAVLQLLDRNQYVYIYICIYVYIRCGARNLLEHVSKQKGGSYRYPECTVQTVIRVTVEIDI